MSFQNFSLEANSALESLHDVVMMWLLMILLVVMSVSISVYLGYSSRLTPDSSFLEQTWTVLPMLILVFIAWPSLHLLCLQDFMQAQPALTIKVISNQWNWSTECLSEENEHLLDADPVDNFSGVEAPVFMKASALSRLVITSSDVLHSLGVPSLGVKLDSIPGRLNCTTGEAPGQGLFLGSCYELCGAGHSSMPINILSV